MRDFILKKSPFIIVIIIILSYGVYFYYVSQAFEKYQKVKKNSLSPNIQRLVVDKKVLLKRIDSINIVIDKLNKKIDTLESYKPKIKIKYVEKYRQIDSSNTYYLCKEFDSIFSVYHVQ